MTNEQPNPYRVNPNQPTPNQYPQQPPPGAQPTQQFPQQPQPPQNQQGPQAGPYAQQPYTQQYPQQHNPQLGQYAQQPQYGQPPMPGAGAAVAKKSKLPWILLGVGIVVVLLLVGLFMLVRSAFTVETYAEFGPMSSTAAPTQPNGAGRDAGERSAPVVPDPSVDDELDDALSDEDVFGRSLPRDQVPAEVVALLPSNVDTSAMVCSDLTGSELTLSDTPSDLVISCGFPNVNGQVVSVTYFKTNDPDEMLTNDYWLFDTVDVGMNSAPGHDVTVFDTFGTYSVADIRSGDEVLVYMFTDSSIEEVASFMRAAGAVG